MMTKIFITIYLVFVFLFILTGTMEELKEKESNKLLILLKFPFMLLWGVIALPLYLIAMPIAIVLMLIK